MSAATRGRRVVQLAGIVVIVVVVSAWKEIIAQYHLTRLLRDGSYLDEIVDAPPESAARLGLQLFAHSADGKQVVLAALVSALCERPQDQPNQVTRVYGRRGPVLGIVKSLYRREFHVADVLHDSELEAAGILLAGSDGATAEMRVWYRRQGARSQHFEQTYSKPTVATLFDLLGEFDDRLERKVDGLSDLRFSVATPAIARRNHDLDVDADSDSRGYALVVTLGPEAIPRLIAKFCSQRGAAVALASLGLDARTLLQVAFGTLEYEQLGWWARTDATTRYKVVAAIEKAAADTAFRVVVIRGIPGFDESLMPHLKQLLLDPDDVVRAETAYRFGYFGPDARGVIPTLLEVIRREEKQYVRRAAVRSLAQVATPADQRIVDTVVKLLDDTDAVVRARAAIVLSSIRSEKPRVVEALTRSLSDPIADVRFRAAQAIGAIGPSAVMAIPALRVAVDDDHGLVEDHAREALAKVLDREANDGVESAGNRAQ